MKRASDSCLYHMPPKKGGREKKPDWLSASSRAAETIKIKAINNLSVSKIRVYSNGKPVFFSTEDVQIHCQTSQSSECVERAAAAAVHTQRAPDARADSFYWSSCERRKRARMCHVTNSSVLLKSNVMHKLLNVETTSHFFNIQNKVHYLIINAMSQYSKNTDLLNLSINEMRWRAWFCLAFSLTF